MFFNIKIFCETKIDANSHFSLKTEDAEIW